MALHEAWHWEKTFLVSSMCSSDHGRQATYSRIESLQSWYSLSHGCCWHTRSCYTSGPVKGEVYPTDLFTKICNQCSTFCNRSKRCGKGICGIVGPSFWRARCTSHWPRKSFGSNLIKLLKMDKTRTSPYHPQGNGQVERHNRVIADVLSKYCAENPRDWDTMLPYVNFVYNTTIHMTTGATRFSLVYGQECQYPIDLFYPKPHHQERTQSVFVDWLDRQFREAHWHARELLGFNQNRQKDQFNKKVFGKPYEVEDKSLGFLKTSS